MISVRRSYAVWSILDFFIFFFKQKTAYEMRISDWSSDVCSSDLNDRFTSSPRYGTVGKDNSGRRYPLKDLAGTGVPYTELQIVLYRSFTVNRQKCVPEIICLVIDILGHTHAFTA